MEKTAKKKALVRVIFLSWVMEPEKKPDKPAFSEENLPSGRLLCLFLSNLALEKPRPLGQFLVTGFEKKGIKAAAMLNRTQRMRRNTQPVALTQRFRDQRNIAKIRQKTTTRLVVGVAHIIAVLDRLSGQFASAGHGITFKSVMAVYRTSACKILQQADKYSFL